MKKNVWLLAVLAVGSALCAQESAPFGKEDVLAAFKQYNPAALEKAAADDVYADILNKLVTSYTAPRTEQNRYELIGLVKNFDNSLRLQLLREKYFESRTLQTMSGTSLAALNAQTHTQIKQVLQDIFDTTIAVKNIQLGDYKAQLKQVRKDKTLPAAEKQPRAAQLNTQIKQLKQEIRQLKQDSKQKVQYTADAYFTALVITYESAQPRQLRAEQSANHDVKANHKKPVAQ
ncbi:MAG: FlxA-like family protein [Elusimicrobiaceae bacterium]|nr:FlxA-like family protein [Elusimicrobiaceae bacterium]